MSVQNELQKRIPIPLLGESTIDWKPYLYLLPALFFYVLFLVYPMIDTFVLSFHQVQTLGGNQKWVGVQNYVAVLTDPLFWQSAVNTVVFSVGMVIIPTVLGLGLALLIDSGMGGGSAFRSLIFVPVVVPVVVSGLVFQWLLGTSGLLNGVLVSSGLFAEPVRFINSPELALPSVMLMVVWKRTGYYMVILLAGLQAIPDDVYEAAKVMGKSRWKMFRNITLPLLKPALLITVILGIIDSIKAFAHVFVMTGGGPSHASEILSTYFFKVAFRYFQFGKGAAFGFVLFAMALVLSFIVMRLSGGSEI
ncbi:MAG: carbohydrate ABC transporter permease [Haloarculaceae archaeon]